MLYAEDMTRQGLSSRQLARLNAKGKIVKIRRGSYVDAPQWNGLSQRSRYGLQVEAFCHASGQPQVLCFATAATLWGLWLKTTPQKIHVLTTDRSRGNNRGDIVRHREPAKCGLVRCGPYLLTDKLSTTLQLIIRLPFEDAVGVCDSALYGLGRSGPINIFSTDLAGQDHVQPIWNPESPQGSSLLRAELLTAIEYLPSETARRRATAVVNFAQARSGSLGESISRVRMDQLGYAHPELQEHFTLRDGRSAYVDFWFRDSRIAGEFDGVEKYLRRDWQGGISTQQRIIEEKKREDQIRAQNVGFVRWTWAEMLSLDRFDALLRQAGVPRANEKSTPSPLKRR